MNPQTSTPILRRFSFLGRGANHGIRSHIHYAGVKGSVGYWATPTGSEIDFVWWHGRKIVAMTLDEDVQRISAAEAQRQLVAALSLSHLLTRYTVPPTRVPPTAPVIKSGLLNNTFISVLNRQHSRGLSCR
jgi:hypothetical protein